MVSLGPYEANTTVCGHVLDVLRELPNECIHTVVTSPPYWGLRDYGTEPQVWGDGTVLSLGLEPSPDLYVQHLVEIFREVRRVLRRDGTLWLNLGASYNSGTTAPQKPSDTSVGNWRNAGAIGNRRVNAADFKVKDLVPIPWMVAMALQADGWWLRSSIIWAKGLSFASHEAECPHCHHKFDTQYSGSCMPESVRDRPTQSYEYVFLLTKSKRYYYDQEAVREPLACPDAADGTRVFGGINKQGANIDHGERTTGRVYDSTPSGRNLRSVWAINPHPFPEAHFATFPPKLIEPMILAGASERGVCPECGTPWERVVETNRTFESGSGKAGNIPEGKHPDGLQGGGETLDIRRGPTVHSHTLGWRPTCVYYDELYQSEFPKAKSARKRRQRDLSGNWWQRVRRQPGRSHWSTVPAIVLDPFMGSGTTAEKAIELGRNFLGIELNQKYIDMSYGRIAVVQPRLL